MCPNEEVTYNLRGSVQFYSAGYVLKISKRARFLHAVVKEFSGFQNWVGRKGKLPLSNCKSQTSGVIASFVVRAMPRFSCCISSQFKFSNCFEALSSENKPLHPRLLLIKQCVFTLSMSLQHLDWDGLHMTCHRRGFLPIAGLVVL